MTERINKADKMVFKALQKAINSDKLHLCLLSSKLNVPSSPVYNPWEVLLPGLIPVVLGLILIWAMGVLWGLAFMIGGILLSNNLNSGYLSEPKQCLYRIIITATNYGILEVLYWSTLPTKVKAAYLPTVTGKSLLFCTMPI